MNFEPTLRAAHKRDFKGLSFMCVEKYLIGRYCVMCSFVKQPSKCLMCKECLSSEDKINFTPITAPVVIIKKGN